MSTIKVDSIQATGETASRAVSGVAAAWGVTENDATVSISFGVSSAVDEEDGKTTVNFTNAFSTSLYPFVVTSQSSNARSQMVNAETTSSIVMHNKNTSNTYSASRMRFKSGGDLA